MALCGCSNYHWGSSHDCSQSLSVPYVQGDNNGQLTNALVYAVASAGFLRYAHHDGDFFLEARLVEINNEQIGYRRGRHNDGRVKKGIMPTEGRQAAVVEITLRRAAELKPFWGPCRISADVDYDYIAQDSINDLSFTNSQGQRTTVLSFSLGQLEPTASAQEAALDPLYRLLAKKIIEVVYAEGLKYGDKRE